jgi:hypothetical protein
VVLAYPWLCIWYRNFILRRRADVLGSDVLQRPFQGIDTTLVREVP